MNASLSRRAGAALLLAASAAAIPAQAQLVYRGFGRIDQSDATFVSITSADMLGLEAVPVRSFSCPVAWGVRNTSADVGGALSAGTLRGVVVDAGSVSAQVQRDLHALLYGRGGGGGIAEGLAPAGSSRAARAAALVLVRRLDGLLAAMERMDPARPGVSAPTRLAAAVAAFDDYLDASASAFLASPSDELLGVHAVLNYMVSGGVYNDDRPDTPPAPGGGLACAVGGVHVELPGPQDSSITEDRRLFQMCTVVESGPTHVYGVITGSGDSLAIVQGQERPLRQEYPAVRPATEVPWFHAGGSIRLGRDEYVRWGGVRDMVPGSVTLFNQHEGVNVYAAPGVPRPRVLYVPVDGGCGFQGYELNTKAING